MRYFTSAFELTGRRGGSHSDYQAFFLPTFCSPFFILLPWEVANLGKTTYMNIFTGARNFYEYNGANNRPGPMFVLLQFGNYRLFYFSAFKHYRLLWLFHLFPAQL